MVMEEAMETRVSVVCLYCTQSWDSVIHLEQKYSAAQQKCHPELGMILTFCQQVKGEVTDGYQEATGDQKVCHIEAGTVPDGHLVR